MRLAVVPLLRSCGVFVESILLVVTIQRSHFAVKFQLRLWRFSLFCKRQFFASYVLQLYVVVCVHLLMEHVNTGLRGSPLWSSGSLENSDKCHPAMQPLLQSLAVSLLAALHG